MRKAFVLSALGLALVLPGAADAARFGGVVVAKDAKRQAVVVASRPTVRTVRAGVFSLTVRSQDGTDFTCDVRPGLDLSAFPVGTQVKLRCHRLDGKFRLGFIKSEKAVVEVPH
jgi:hypothetical protein